MNAEGGIPFGWLLALLAIAVSLGVTSILKKRGAGIWAEVAGFFVFAVALFFLRSYWKN
ncbi:hypothetical protein [Phragmitibacter flavus]|uniref:hypothetical protein n=1 Tax=Phragmitibacter flavus TaxID=2576071 RepID=UPI0014095300|nr:hypothetical protein [Phragmitibacter flavus]